MRVLLPALVVLALLPNRGSASADKEASGFYRVERLDGTWSAVAPDGRPFFSLGVDCVDRGATRDGYRPGLPQYAAFRHYPSDAAWAADTIGRLRAWGFNTLGAWSDDDALGRARAPLPYTVELELGGSARVPWCDLFGKEIEAIFDKVAREQVLPRRDDPLLLGYFSDNELGWWDDTLFVAFLREPATNATRKVLIGLLERHYGHSFGRLLRDWEPVGASSFAELERGGALTLRPGGRGINVVHRFVYLCAQRYYRLARDAIRRYDRHHLILGDRYAQWASEPVVRAAGPFADVISTNYGADWRDGGICHYYLDVLHRLTGKPILITEFYFSATENRSGNANAPACFPVVGTQRERAAGFLRNVLAFASRPYVIGAHWFQYYDEPTSGRSDGENYDFGLVDIDNRPYEALTAAAREASQAIPRLRSCNERGAKRGTVPRAPANVLDGLILWDRDRAFVPPSTGTPFADLYGCWDAGTLYVAVYAADYVDEHLYRQGHIPDTERMALTVGAGVSCPPIVVRFGTGGKAAVEGSGASVHEWPGLKHTLLLAIPAQELGRRSLRPGEAVALRATLTRHSRAGTMTWRTSLRLGADAGVRND